MSASREKKQRQSDPDHGLTQKQRKELQEQQAAKRKTILYTGIGVIAAVLVAALLVWDSGIFQRSQTALTVDGHNYNVNDVSYYYIAALNNEYINSVYYGTSTFDSSIDPAEQYVDEDQTQTYRDYFLEQATESLTQAAAVEDAAEEAGYTLSDEEIASVDAQIASAKQTAESYGYTSFAGYLKSYYGKYMTASAYRTCLERAALISSYTQYYSDQLEITDEDIQSYYEENKDSLDTFEYYAALIDGTAESTTDEDGNTVDPTDEETQAAMEAAKALADAFAAQLEEADDKAAAFTELLPDYLDEDSVDTYDDMITNVGSSIYSTSYYGSWLKDADRQPGDVTVVEGSSGYYVVLLVDRYLDETATANIRHILILADTAEEDDPDTTDIDESTEPTQEALDAAKAEAEDLLAQWEAGDRTAESFAELANEYSDDPGSNTNGGLYEDVYEGEMFDAFNDWIFGQDHQEGDTGLVENTQSGQQGWHIIYFQSWSDPTWKQTADSALRSERTSAWLEEVTADLEATQASGIKYVG